MDEVENFRRRPPEINLDVSAEHVRQYGLITHFVWVPIAVLAALVFVGSVVSQGAENIRNTIAAHEVQ